MRDLLKKYIARLIAEEVYDDEEDIWIFKDGSPCSICTSASNMVARAFGGDVVGYDSAMNPTAILGHSLCSGHDFAIIDERWIVDYWAYRVVKASSHVVLDLKNAREKKIVNRLYGCMNTWTKIISYKRGKQNDATAKLVA